ncbi:MAG: DNA repair exonuclease [Candidatus Limnocylindrales bacterium]
MPRLLHLADVHLGARHPDLGPAASRLRERQAAAFRRAIDAGIEARVDVALICGDLFDSNAQGRRVVEAAALELRRLTEQSIRVVLIPGIHDSWEGGSIYRVFDLRLMAGLSEGSDLLTVLTPQHPEVVYRDLDLIVHGRVPTTRRVARSPLADFTVLADDRARWRVGMIHGALTAGSDDGQDDVRFTAEEIAASGLDYLAIGHGHGWQTGRAGSTTWTSPGAVEGLQPGDETAGRVAIVELAERSGRKSVEVREAVVGRTRFSTVTLDAADAVAPGALVARLRTLADPDVVLDVVVRGVAERWLDIDQAALSAELADAFLAVRLRDESQLAPPAATDALPGTLERTFQDALLEHASAAERAGDSATARDARAAYQLGRRLLDDPQQVGLI